jgi:hypothetical protein
MQIVDIKSAHIAHDLLSAVIAPVMTGISDDVTMGANRAPVIGVNLQLLVGQLIDVADVPEDRAN